MKVCPYVIERAELYLQIPKRDLDETHPTHHFGLKSSADGSEKSFRLATR
jgi:hypothetical protein